ncbi:MAG: DNA gyrase C-terminal beta-propeller domain-containing protein, partial [Gemmataceae bacterium]
TKVGRRYVRLFEKDEVVLARVLTDENTLMLVSEAGRVLHFSIDEINILSGIGKGVMGIKLEQGDACLGGLAMSRDNTTLVVETSDGKTMEFTRRYEVVGRGGKGFEAVKRRSFKRVVAPPIQLVNWDEVEMTGEESRPRKSEAQRGLFDKSQDAD